MDSYIAEKYIVCKNSIDSNINSIRRWNNISCCGLFDKKRNKEIIKNIDSIHEKITQLDLLTLEYLKISKMMRRFNIYIPDNLEFNLHETKSKYHKILMELENEYNEIYYRYDPVTLSLL